MIPVDCEALSAHLREDIANLLACLPAVRRSAEHTLADTVCISTMATAAYRALRSAENLAAWGVLAQVYPQQIAGKPFAAAALASSFFEAAAVVCPAAHIACAVPDAPLYTIGNASLFVVCLGNLLANSLAYAQDIPQAVLTVERQGNNAVFTLRDTGKGMQIDTLGKALTPWVSQDPYLDGAPAPGLGLGLALAQKYAAAYKGLLAVQSNFGHGCTVAISLPCCPAPAQNAAFAATPASFLQNRYSTLYAQLCDVCTLPE